MGLQSKKSNRDVENTKNDDSRKISVCFADNLSILF